ncbi:MAG: hypothetical protein AB8F78_18180 [Saprospiraceae bacterium]
MKSLFLTLFFAGLSWLALGHPVPIEDFQFIPGALTNSIASGSVLGVKGAATTGLGFPNEPYTSYNAHVYAVDSLEQYSAMSALVSFSTNNQLLDNQAPTAPSNLQVANLTATSLDVTFVPVILSDESDLSLANFHVGMYVLRIVFSDGQITNQRILLE